MLGPQRWVSGHIFSAPDQGGLIFARVNPTNPRMLQCILEPVGVTKTRMSVQTVKPSLEKTLPVLVPGAG